MEAMFNKNGVGNGSSDTGVDFDLYAENEASGRGQYEIVEMDVMVELARIDSEERRIKRLMEIIGAEKKKLKEAKEFLLDHYDLGVSGFQCVRVQNGSSISYYEKGDDGRAGAKLYVEPSYKQLQIVYGG